LNNSHLKFCQVSIGAGSTESRQASSNEKLLKDILSWLVINSMRVDGIQFNLLCEQSVTNVWRKRSFLALTDGHRLLDSDSCSKLLNQSLQVFRERIDFEIENSVPITERYSEKIATIIESHRYILIIIPYDNGQCYFNIFVIFSVICWKWWKIEMKQMPSLH
jgi:hypothetical protein